MKERGMGKTGVSEGWRRGEWKEGEREGWRREGESLRIQMVQVDKT